MWDPRNMVYLRPACEKGEKIQANAGSESFTKNVLWT
jgi:hypothetical protein